MIAIVDDYNHDNNTTNKIKDNAKGQYNKNEVNNINRDFNNNFWKMPERIILV